MSQLQKDKIYYGGVGMTQKQMMKRSEHQCENVRDAEGLARDHWYQKKNRVDRGRS